MYMPKYLQLKNPGLELLLIHPVSVYLDVKDALHLKIWPLKNKFTHMRAQKESKFLI